MFWGVAVGLATTAEAQFLGFDLPRPGRSLSKAPPPNETHVPHPAVVRVTVDERTSLSHGTGVLVATQDQYALVVTNWHVVRDVAGAINVIFPSGFISPARIVKVDKDWDLAALGIWNPNVPPIPVSKAPPRVGDALTIAGYGSGQYRAVTGRCNQYLSPGERFPYEMIEVSVEARRGDSGGPILNQRGEVAGVLFGASTGTTSGSHSGRVRRFLTPWLAIVDRPPGAIAPQVPGSLEVPPTTAGAFAATNSGPTGTARTSDTVTYDSGASLLAPQPGLSPPTQPLGGPVASNSGVGAQTPFAQAPAASPWGSDAGGVASGGGLLASPFAAPASAGHFTPLSPYQPGRPESSGSSLAPVPIAGDSLNASSRDAQAAALAARAAALERESGTKPPAGTAADVEPGKSKRSDATPLDHLKNVLAIVGVLAVVFHLFRRSPAATPDDDE